MSKVRIIFIYNFIKEAGMKGITQTELSMKLYDAGMKCDRRSIYHDYDCLMDTGEPFSRSHGPNNERIYFYGVDDAK
jgi:hypothetical protein